ncbi:gfo/Idh/MocA family oxidoreductase [Lysinibacillus sp. 2017]|uniref:Gfo/Idh/MocA family protein n=1 Tax=unclassified Lysinibacillus TaxID=2636778 RepID=UPI000D527863|nr:MULTISPECIES: Gfo/Idh/MocA family oxidoreductase [unclassified Lysinibacillus]AWE08520.1 gfo/Idh/MocA family oxidoreductase [Lysinibacillus sp. 2017]TGN35613.1 Gfo/Idh/MocA family oxidoreductase [Lysinibacillus sp. S2017]
MKKVKWGILSTADIAQTQVIPAIQRADNAEVVAIASRGAKVHDVAQVLNIPHAYESYDELLQDPEVEVIYIPLPNDMHKEWSIKAAEAGKHVLCEKPVVLLEEDLEDIIAAFSKHNKGFMEAFMYQFHPQHQRVKEILTSGEIGEVKLYKSSHSFYFEQREGNIRMDASKGGGALWDVGCYSLHALQYFLEEQVLSMSFKANFDETTGVDVTACGIIMFENDVMAIIDCSFDMTGRNEYEIVGTKGTVKVKTAFRPDVYSGDAQIIVTTGTTERVEHIQGDIYKLEVEYFSDKVLDGSSFEEQHKASRKTTKLLLQAYASLKDE